MASPGLDPWCARFAPALRNPPPPRPGVCATCRGPAPAERDECSSCRWGPARLDAVLPVSWSLARGPLHHALRGYKDGELHVVRQESAAGLRAVLDRFLRDHEGCLAAVAGVDRFELVTTVPARFDRRRDALRALVRGCPSVAGRFASALVATGPVEQRHRFDPERFRARWPLAGRSILLVDDTWTTGASAQSAAHALKRAGARRVALVVIGRHVNPGFSDHARYAGETPPFAWETCAAHGHGRATRSPAPHATLRPRQP